MVISTGIDMLFSIVCMENSRAAWNPSDMILGWIPLSSNDSAAFKNAPARITTVVVPSPASTSWAFEISTNWDS